LYICTILLPPWPTHFPYTTLFRSIDDLLRRENPRIGSAPLILLNPNASDLLPLRRWPAMRYVELARRLLERYPDLFIGFTGSPADRKSTRLNSSHDQISYAVFCLK